MKKNLKLWLVIMSGIIIAGVVYYLMQFIEPMTFIGLELPHDKVSSCQEVAPTYVGLKEKDAIKKAKIENRDYRIVGRDGVSFTVTMDYVIERLNFSINDNIIESTNCG